MENRFSIIDFHDLLHGDTGHYRGLQGIARGYRVLQGVTRGNRITEDLFSN